MASQEQIYFQGVKFLFPYEIAVTGHADFECPYLTKLEIDNPALYQ